MSTIKISRQGLTVCPACSKHIQVAERLAETVCPFCNAELGEALATASRDPGPMQRLAGSGRSAIIAASMMGMPLVGCADGEDGPADPVDMVADSTSDIMNTPVYGMPADDVGPSVPEDSTAEDAELSIAEEPVASAMYGVPGDFPGDE